MDLNQLSPIIEFNFAPAGYIDASWLESLPNSNIIETLTGSAVTAHWASRHILRSYDLVDKVDLDFSRLEKQMALSSRKYLTPIVYHAGLALNAPLLKGILKREERAAVEACIGKESYHLRYQEGTFSSRKIA